MEDQIRQILISQHKIEPTEAGRLVRNHLAKILAEMILVEEQCSKDREKIRKINER